MKRLLTSFLLVAIPFGSSTADEIDYVEDFALAEDRRDVLDQLIPGTEEHFYYHGLHLLSTEQFDRVDELLRQWKDGKNDSARSREIRHRLALLRFDVDPAKTLEYLRTRLNPRLDHRPQTRDNREPLPHTLDSAVLTRDAFLKRMRVHQRALEGIVDTSLVRFVDDLRSPVEVRAFLTRLQRPDVPGLPRLVIENLNHKPRQSFGDLPIHRALLLSQLDECLELAPKLRNERAFVDTYLGKLHPSADVAQRFDQEAREAYLDRLWSFAKTLAPAHNSLKALVLYHRLVHDRSQGTYDRAQFLEYLALPRRAGYVKRSYLNHESRRAYHARLDAQYAPLSSLPPIGTDDSLVRDYLQHFFQEDTTTKAYSPYIDDRYLKELFAETKILHGLGELEQWYSMLPPEKYRSLQERVEIEFAKSNPKTFGRDEIVHLDVDIKNVSNLIVKIYQIDARSLYREKGVEAQTDINLDGLVPNHELQFDYDLPSWRRERRSFELAMISGPGVWVVDFIGNGINSRALIRKGELRHVERTVDGGQVLNVFDERDRLVEDALVWVDGHEYQAGENGDVAIPFTRNPKPQKIVLSHGDLSTLSTFEHRAESYVLKAGIYIDRESLVDHRRARVLVRPSLSVSSTPISLSRLQDVRLVLTSTDLHGTSVTKEIPEFELFESQDSVYDFQTPKDLLTLTVELRASIENLSEARKDSLSVQESFAINGIDHTETIGSLFLRPNGPSFVIELLGRNGEPLTSRTVKITAKHRDFRHTHTVSLEADSRGRLALGPLQNIQWIQATCDETRPQTWNLLSSRHEFHQTIHRREGEDIILPALMEGQSRAPLTRGSISLLERRGSGFVIDHFDKLSMKDNRLVLSGLPKGDYRLRLEDAGRDVTIRVTDGPDRSRYILGAHRHLERRGSDILHLGDMHWGDDQLEIQVYGGDAFSRVHLFGTRFLPAFNAYDRLSRVRDREPRSIDLAHISSAYLSGRNIGDEYRYILDRRQSTRYPGNMLTRPSLLLNPWSIRSTDTDIQAPQAGSRLRKVQADERKRALEGTAPSESASSEGDLSNLDFLAHGPLVEFNLRPDEDGKIRVPLASLRGLTSLQAVAVGPIGLSTRTYPLERTEPSAHRDVRFQEGLTASKSYTQQKLSDILNGDELFHVDDISTSRVEIYDTLPRVYSFYTSLTRDETLAKFDFTMNWPSLDPEQKRAKYSKFACHELNFFLFKKDPEFFDTVVRPHLENKLHKTFLDDWLLERPLQDYLNSRRYSRLNAVEKILLGQRIASEARQASRWLEDQLSLRPRAIDDLHFRFDTALKRSAFDDDTLLAAVPRDTLRAKAPVANAAPGGPGTPGPGAPSPKTKARRPATGGFPAGGGGRGRRGGRAQAGERDKESLERYKDTAFFEKRELSRDSSRAYYREPELTKEWAENNYYHLPINAQDASLVTTNPFWVELAKHPQGAPFLSAQFITASSNFTEMMFALSFLDLPFEAESLEPVFDGAKMTLRAKTPLILFHEGIQETADAEEALPILVSQNYYRTNDRYREIDNQQVEKYVRDEFLIHESYGCQIAITNPSSMPRSLELLLQIPRGSLPLSGTRETHSLHVDMPPFSTQTVEYKFYFPFEGQFSHYPVHVSEKEKVVSRAAPSRLRVVAKESRPDRDTWEAISQSGSDQEVLDFLESQNLLRVDLSKIAHRMRHHRFFASAIELLDKRHTYDPTLWGYSFVHKEASAIRTRLENDDGFVSQCGAYLRSPLLDIDPVERLSYQYLDYRPLINARAHRLGKERQILNDRLHAQYHRWLHVLKYKRALDDDDRLSVVSYLLMQDRIEEARHHFAKVDRSALDTHIQYDYVNAYLAFYEEDVDRATRIASRHVDYPVDRWRLLFENVLAQAHEIQGGEASLTDATDRTQRQTELADRAPSFEFDVEAKTIDLVYQNLDQVSVHYFLMDIELLFSRNPFVGRFAGQFSPIRPNLDDRLSLSPTETRAALPLPADLHNQNVLVQVRGGGETKTKVYYSNSLDTQVIENYGQIRVSEKGSAKPLSKVYVKVYARKHSGKVAFYKDGYTDLRGRFDYASLSTPDIRDVERFAILVLSDDHGAIIREASVPKR